MNKDLNYYLGLKYPIVIREDVESGKAVYSLEVPDLPGCGAEGETLDEGKKNLEEARKLWIEDSIERGIPIPEPIEEYSGRILLRIQPVLHGQLSKKARQAKVSLNKYISGLLEAEQSISAVLEEMASLKKEFGDVRKLLEQMHLERYRTTLVASGIAFTQGEMAVTNVGSFTGNVGSFTAEISDSPSWSLPRFGTAIFPKKLEKETL